MKLDHQHAKAESWKQIVDSAVSRRRHTQAETKFNLSEASFGLAEKERSSHINKKKILKISMRTTREA